MLEWPYEVEHTDKFDITRFCVQDEVWQEFRLSLKGVSTERKLMKLEQWRFKGGDANVQTAPNKRTQVQIDNYINALLRGGQLVRRDGKIVVQR